MISAPLGDFRHTMHIGRGGDTFGDTSFLSTVGPSPSNPDDQGNTVISPPVETEVTTDHVDSNQALHSESVSSFTLDLDLDLGPSMLGDVLGVMDGLGMEEVFSPTSSVSSVEIDQGKNGAMEKAVELKNELNGKNLVDENLEGDSRIPDGNGLRPNRSLRPKVRFSDKREEIIRQASEEEEGQDFDFQDDDEELQSPSQVTVDNERSRGVINGSNGDQTMEPITGEQIDLPPSPASSHSSEYEGVTPLDRRKMDICHSETDSEEEDEEVGKGYTFEDEFDDEIGL